MALMASSPEQALTGRQRAALETLLRDLRTIFGARLHALVAYGLASTNVDESYVRTLGLVERVAFEDLARGPARGRVATSRPGRATTALQA